METMKKSLLIIKVIILTGSHAFGQRDLQKPLMESNSLSSVYFNDANTALSIGNNNIISNSAPINVSADDSSTTDRDVCYLTVYPLEQIVTADSGIASFNITMSGGSCLFYSNAEWCTLSYLYRSPDILLAHYSTNETDSTRFAVIHIHKMQVNSCGPMDAVVLLYQNGNQGVGIEENSMADFRIYPNPGNGNFTIISPKGTENANLEANICDMSGRIILTRNLQGQAEYHFDLSSEPEGIYFIRINSNDGILSENYVTKLVFGRNH
jgi:hypothetical protein